MSVSGISSTIPSLQPPQSLFQQRMQDFNKLAQSLQSNDLQGALQAYNSLQQLSSAGPNTNSNNPLQNDWQTLGNALNSGSLSQAQSAFSQLQSDLQSQFQGQSAAAPQGMQAHRGHGHHHHHSSSSSESSTSSTTDTAGSGSTGSSSTSNSTNTGTNTVDLTV
jgi:hypothetical protein